MTTGVSLRAYQQRGIAELRAAFARGRKAPCYVSPTGSGKTRVAAEIMRLLVGRGKRALFLARRVELLDQCARSLQEIGLPARVIQAERNGADSPIVVASVPTLVSDGWADRLPEANLVIWDECHGIKARTSLELKQRYPHAYHLGLTATPARGDGSPLGDAFDEIVVGVTVAELVALGHLVPARVFAPATILDPRTLALEPVEAFERHCAGRQTIVFAASVEHARTIAVSFTTRGVRAEYVSGESRDRSDVIARYAAGETQVLVNVSILVEGWDDPPTSAAIFARRFTHAGSYLQACGRTLRPAPSKSDAVIVDLCGSALVHGTPDAERTFSLDGKAIRTNDREPLRQCSTCGGVTAGGRPACPYCGAAFPTAVRALPTASGVGVAEVPARVKPTSWPMRAKKRGLCAGCGQAIEPGTWIVYSATRRTAQHTACAARSERRAA